MKKMIVALSLMSFSFAANALPKNITCIVKVGDIECHSESHYDYDLGYDVSDAKCAQNILFKLTDGSLSPMAFEGNGGSGDFFFSKCKAESDARVELTNSLAGVELFPACDNN